VTGEVGNAVIDGFSFLGTRPVAALGVVVVTWLITRIVRRIIRRVVRRVSFRAVDPTGWGGWVARIPRRISETPDVAEHRRRQRVDATTRMFAHLFNLIAWVCAGLVILHLFDIDPVIMLSGAGFIGAGLAIGGQQVVKDYLAGMSILVEDRFGVGDRLVVDNGGQRVEGTVEHVGSLTTRLRDGAAAWHLSNGSLTAVQNLSQRPVTTEVSIDPGPPSDPDTGQTRAIARAVEQAAGGQALTGVVLLDDVQAQADSDGGLRVAVTTSRPLTAAETERIRRVARRALSGDDRTGRSRTTVTRRAPHADSPR
jgi:small conductance mechanosensitive channel